MSLCKDSVVMPEPYTASGAVLSSGTAVAISGNMTMTTSRIVLSFFSAALAITVGCGDNGKAGLTGKERSAIATAIRQQVITAYDLKKPDVVASLMSLYPESGQVISASSGRVTTSRQDLELQITSFWDRIGKNMRNPRWEWTSMKIDVFSADAAAMTATYRVPHLTPAGQPHVIGGAWTAIFKLQKGRWVIIQEHLSDSPSP